MEQKATIDGIFALTLGLYTYVNPVPTVTGAPNLVKLLTHDCKQLTSGIKEEAEAIQLPGWMRALAIISGIISIIAAIVVIVNPLIALRTLVMLFAVALLFIGIERLIVGISGKSHRLIVHRRAATT